MTAEADSTPQRRRLHPAVAPLLVGAAAVTAAAMVHFVDPNEPGHYPTCPWLMVTGTFCPGCGTMRCIHALTNLDIVGALQMNVLTVAMLPILAVSYFAWLYRSFRPPRRQLGMAHPFWLWLLLVVILAFWLLRNLPFAAFLAPG
ncbi:hypothetical protein HDA32_003664 [Spinactinospora alkalitolerans]|uniref:DUF2752 domain-containing protein n=1 Tax=Spinactinospora alkalitolerans TaxID=687207 RepID=A0A852U331_9ACTN|nr:DUF2752 domain-containing protein [Spinactinospora alkalitolerans]NYE48544.1 hypothetical protein [Spinactinospora alkalitolerans]